MILPHYWSLFSISKFSTFYTVSVTPFSLNDVEELPPDLWISSSANNLFVSLSFFLFVWFMQRTGAIEWCKIVSGSYSRKHTDLSPGIAMERTIENSTVWTCLRLIDSVLATAWLEEKRSRLSLSLSLFPCFSRLAHSPIQQLKTNDDNIPLYVV